MRCTVWRGTKEFTMRLILIDSNSGFIAGEFCTSDYTGNYDRNALFIVAATAVDADIGTTQPCTYTPCAFQDNAYGYQIYRADVGGSEQVPAVFDGTDTDFIRSVERDCEHLGFVECIDAA